MEYEKIKKLMDDMGNSKLTALDIDFPDGTKIRMKKENKTIITEAVVEERPVQEETIQNSVVKVEEKHNTEIEDGKIVKSPMVGTFYRKSSPAAEAYVEIGKKVKKGDVLCIIEAMKLMNEIESEFDGEIVEILVEDGKPVEYGAPLFKIK